MTPAGLARLKADEGCRLHAYQDTGGVWTVGVGCTGPDIGPHTIWTQGQADAELLKRVASTEAELGARLEWFGHLDPVRQDVMVNMAFNVGVAGLERWPVTLQAIQEGHYAAAADDILDNHLWRSQVHARADRCAAAMRSGRW